MIQKFRAWDKKENNWVDYPIYIDANGDVYWEHYERGLQEADDLIVMQSTGLVDKNGVEIFEGDWIRVETQAKDNGEFPIGYVARANDKPEMFIALPEQHKETGERQYHLENLYKHYSDEFEVIGNIYENSDLMEVTA